MVLPAVAVVLPLLTAALAGVDAAEAADAVAKDMVMKRGCCLRQIALVGDAQEDV